MAEQAAETEAQEEQSDQQEVEVREAELAEAGQGATQSAPGQIDILLDSTVAVSAKLGEAEMQVRDLLHLGPGSVVKLDRGIGEPIDLYMRGIHFATGQLVVVGENLAVRIKETVGPPAEEQEQPA